MGLLWIRRSLAFQSRLFESLLPSDGLHPKDAATEAYREILSPYHGWLLQKIFPTSLSQMPHRQVFLSTFGEIDIKRFNGNGFLNEIPNNSFDMVLTFRNTHNWVKAGVINEVYGSINRVLKKDGILGVVQHRGKNSQDHIIASKSGYVPEKYLIELVEKMNFKFISKSEINRNLLDTKDYKEGV